MDRLYEQLDVITSLLRELVEVEHLIEIDEHGVPIRPTIRPPSLTSGEGDERVELEYQELRDERELGSLERVEDSTISEVHFDFIRIGSSHRMVEKLIGNMPKLYIQYWNGRVWEDIHHF